LCESEHGFLGLISRATAHLRGRGIDVVHSHRYKENLLAYGIARRLGIPRVVRTEHGLGEPFHGWAQTKQRLIRAADQWVARHRTAAVIAVSSEMQRTLSSRLSSRQLLQVYNGIDPASVTSGLSSAVAKERLGLDGNPPVVGYAGRLDPIKRLDLLVKAAQHARQELPELKFVIAGEGPQEDALRRDIAAAGLSGSFKLLGHREDQYDVLRAFDVVTLCSDHEGIPMVLLEAMNLQVPVVARKVGGIPEMVENESSGLLVDSGDPKPLASAWLRVLSDAGLRSRLEHGAMARVQQRFTAQQNADAVVNLYVRLSCAA